MMYPFLTLRDGTEIMHSDPDTEGKVKVYIETPDEKYCFRHMTLTLPDYSIKEVYRYTEDESERYIDIVKSTAHLISFI